MIYVAAVILSAVLILLDQITKYLAVQHLKPVQSIELIKGVFELAFVENRGAAFGIFAGGRWFFVTITVAIIIGIIVYFVKMPRTKIYDLVRLTLILVASGAVGNFIDRFRNGYVVDFFYFKLIDFPVFNFADSFLVVGTIILAILLLFFIDDKKTAPKAADDTIETDVSANMNVSVVPDVSESGEVKNAD